jgi:hypothetical protein
MVRQTQRRNRLSNSGKNTVDCLTNDYSIEFDFAEKWVQSMRKSRDQSLSTGKAPGIVLILQNSADEKLLFKLREVVEKKTFGDKDLDSG